MTNRKPDDLPDLLQFQDGQPVRTAQDWPRRRQELLDLILPIEYGCIPPAPAVTHGEELYSGHVARYSHAGHAQYRLSIGADPGVHFILDILIPPTSPTGSKPFPVVINGDGCWKYINDEIILSVLQRGMVLAQFNRVEIVPDNHTPNSANPLHQMYPNLDFGALTAWAWGYHRCVDFLSTLDFIDPTRIAVFGHSRGGKTTLLAGATDPRIALTAANCSGCGGAGCFRHEGQGSETLSDILQKFPYWFSPRLQQYIGRASDLPFDQHFLKALIAPRPLLTSECVDDLWANPSGAWATHAAAREAYRLLGAENKIGIHYRPGVHEFSPADWKVFLDFADWHFNYKPTSCQFDANPFDVKKWV